MEVGRGQVRSEIADLNAGLKGGEPIWLIECFLFCFFWRLEEKN